MITDPLGRRVGYNPASDQIVNEIPGAFYSGTETDEEFVIIPGGLDGSYQVTTTGIGDGEFTVSGHFVDAVGSQTFAVITGTTTLGQLMTQTLVYSPNLQTIFADDMEAGPGNWGATGNWVLTTTVTGQADTHSPPTVWAVEDTQILSPPLVLTLTLQANDAITSGVPISVTINETVIITPSVPLTLTIDGTDVITTGTPLTLTLMLKETDVITAGTPHTLILSETLVMMPSVPLTLTVYEKRILSPGTPLTLTLKTPLDLSQVRRARLSFWYSATLSSQAQALVEGSTDDGQTWFTLAKQPTGQARIISGTGNYSSSAILNSGWNRRVLSLSAFSGPGNSPLRLRFRLTPGSRADRWWLDDVRIEEVIVPDLYPFPFRDDVEGLRYWDTEGDWQPNNQQIHSGNLAWRSGQTGDMLTLIGNILVPQSVTPTLTFWQVVSPSIQGTVDLSTDGGISWIPIYTATSPATDWMKVMIPLPEAMGLTTTLRFRQEAGPTAIR